MCAYVRIIISSLKSRADPSTEARFRGRVTGLGIDFRSTMETGAALTSREPTQTFDVYDRFDRLDRQIDSIESFDGRGMVDSRIPWYEHERARHLLPNILVCIGFAF